MRLHRFFVNQELRENSTITIDSADLAHQILRVFRLGQGDEIILFNGTHFDYKCKLDFQNDKSTIVSDTKADCLRVNIGGKMPSAYSPTRNIKLCAAVVKKDTFEWIVEKATELGVTEIIPVMAERSEKKGLNENRLKKIVIEASEQSGRGDVPSVGAISSISDLLVSKVQGMAFHLDGELFDKAKNANSPGNDSPLFVFIGPEGGWSQTEVEMFHTNNIPIYSMGSQILRAETAVVAALSLIMLGK